MSSNRNTPLIGQPKQKHTSYWPTRTETHLIGQPVQVHLTDLSVILSQADHFAKGLLAHGLKPGEDDLAVIGCSSTNAIALFVACCSIGIGFAVS